MVIYDNDGEQLEMEIAQDYTEILNKEYSISFDQRFNCLHQKYIKNAKEEQEQNKAYLTIIRLLKQKSDFKGETVDEI